MVYNTNNQNKKTNKYMITNIVFWFKYEYAHIPEFENKQALVLIHGPGFNVSWHYFIKPT